MNGLPSDSNFNTYGDLDVEFNRVKYSFTKKLTKHLTTNGELATKLRAADAKNGALAKNILLRNKARSKGELPDKYMLDGDENEFRKGEMYSSVAGSIKDDKIRKSFKDFTRFIRGMRGEFQLKNIGRNDSTTFKVGHSENLILSKRLAPPSGSPLPENERNFGSAANVFYETANSFASRLTSEKEYFNPNETGSKSKCAIANNDTSASEVSSNSDLTSQNISERNSHRSTNGRFSGSTAKEEHFNAKLKAENWSKAQNYVGHPLNQSYSGKIRGSFSSDVTTENIIESDSGDCSNFSFASDLTLKSVNDGEFRNSKNPFDSNLENVNERISSESANPFVSNLILKNVNDGSVDEENDSYVSDSTSENITESYSEDHDDFSFSSYSLSSDCSESKNPFVTYLTSENANKRIYRKTTNPFRVDLYSTNVNNGNSNKSEDWYASNSTLGNVNKSDFCKSCKSSFASDLNVKNVSDDNSDNIRNLSTSDSTSENVNARGSCKNNRSFASDLTLENVNGKNSRKTKGSFASENKTNYCKNSNFTSEKNSFKLPNSNKKTNKNVLDYLERVYLTDAANFSDLECNSTKAKSFDGTIDVKYSNPGNDLSKGDNNCESNKKETININSKASGTGSFIAKDADMMLEKAQNSFETRSSGSTRLATEKDSSKGENNRKTNENATTTFTSSEVSRAAPFIASKIPAKGFKNVEEPNPFSSNLTFEKVDCNIADEAKEKPNHPENRFLTEKHRLPENKKISIYSSACSLDSDSSSSEESIADLKRRIASHCQKTVEFGFRKNASDGALNKGYRSNKPKLESPSYERRKEIVNDSKSDKKFFSKNFPNDRYKSYGGKILSSGDNDMEFGDYFGNFPKMCKMYAKPSPLKRTNSLGFAKDRYGKHAENNYFSKSSSDIFGRPKYYSMESFSDNAASRNSSWNGNKNYHENCFTSNSSMISDNWRPVKIDITRPPRIKVRETKTSKARKLLSRKDKISHRRFVSEYIKLFPNNVYTSALKLQPMFTSVINVNATNFHLQI